MTIIIRSMMLLLMLLLMPIQKLLGFEVTREKKV